MVNWIRKIARSVLKETDNWSLPIFKLERRVKTFFVCVIIIVDLYKPDKMLLGQFYSWTTLLLLFLFVIFGFLSCLFRKINHGSHKFIWNFNMSNIILVKNITSHRDNIIIRLVHDNIVLLHDVFHIGLIIGPRTAAVLAWATAEGQYCRPRSYN